ncbi:hypothetical protein F511_30260 [Dorcoceras hygrometricum]|uniref:Uncharacterized protein n=1 Tax=Dorcoceras hygrometricum TaxID=472368 RepID=A0A2Z7C737_9LAMI|nr:hypothetical protein F511_30260 [Dorcoceras hygrometricum]
MLRSELKYLSVLTRGPNSALQARPTLPRLGTDPRTRFVIVSLPEDPCSARRIPGRYAFPYLSKRIPRITENIRRDILFPPPLPLYKYQTSRRSASHPPVLDDRRPDARALDVVVALG